MDPHGDGDAEIHPTKRDFVLIRVAERFQWKAKGFVLSLFAMGDTVVSSGETQNGVFWMAWETKENHEKRLGAEMLEEGR